MGGIMKKEYWKPVIGYEGLYEVSNWGRVKSLERYNLSNCLRKGRILKQKQCKDGYKSVTLYKDGKRKIIFVHRLVAQAFIPNPNNYPYVNHKDENKQNNIVTNLEWCDAKYNTNFGTCIERRSKKKSKPVLQYDLEGNFIKEWKSTRECGRNGFNQSVICKCCRKLEHYKSAYGYIWEYKNEED